MFVILSIHQGFAQHDHGGGGTHDTPIVQKNPHGGQLKQFGKYKVEMVADLFLAKDKLSFYLFQKNLKPINYQNITGKVEIHYNDGTESKSDLVLKQGNRFVSQLDKTIGFHCVLEIIINEKKITFDFVQKGI